jgi:hypothetical protein
MPNKTAKNPSIPERAQVIINKAIEDLKLAKNEKTIREIIIYSWQELEKLVPNENSFRKIRKEFRDALKAAFPSRDTTKAKPKGYYRTSAGQTAVEGGDRYEHLSLWYATTNKQRWNIIGDIARTKYFTNLPKLPNNEQSPEQVQPPIKTVEQSIEQPVEQPTQAPLTLEAITLEDLKLDPETAKTVTAALAHSHMSLSDFLQQACKVYAKTVMGRVAQENDDLSIVPTEELKEASKYNTHPGRATELVRRAIKAIKIHNAAATELAYKWAITQTLLQELTGSRPGKVKEILQQFASDIENYNAQLKADYGLDDTKLKYLNRKDKSIQKPDLVTLVPDGLDI